MDALKGDLESQQYLTRVVCPPSPAFDAEVMSLTWTKIAQGSSLQRSSHTVSVIGSTLHVFGGELKPRQPRDGDVHQLDLSAWRWEDQIQEPLKVHNVPATRGSPSPRVGSATTTFKDQIWLFSGRGGEAMAPVDDQGQLWVFKPSTSTWTTVAPRSAQAPYPEARSYHCMTSDDEHVYVHAGCPESGRLSDLWAFNVSAQQWKQLASAPDPPRGGASIAYVDGRLMRMNGFDGKTEQGGAIDVYDRSANTWSSIYFDADGESGPGARSVATLLPVQMSGGLALVTLFGESDPSSLGHQGAGNMLGDIWAYSLQESEWNQFRPSNAGLPSPRGWFDADIAIIDGKNAIAVTGGLDEHNQRLDDAWALTLE